MLYLSSVYDLLDICGRESCAITQKDNVYTVKINMAGIPKESIKVEVDNNILSVRSYEKNDQDETKTLHFKRILPDGIDVKKIEATKEDGMLILTLPKLENQKAIEIKIN